MKIYFLFGCKKISICPPILVHAHYYCLGYIKMNHRNAFRTLVIATNLGYVLSALLYFYLDNGQLEAAYAAMPKGFDFDSYLSNDFISAIVIIGIVTIWALSVIGLLLFKNWGRTLTVSSFIVGLLFIALLGPTIEFGLESALNELVTVCSGIIFASMYLHPISAEFNNVLKRATSVPNNV